jgi:hypothetical protein
VHHVCRALGRVSGIRQINALGWGQAVSYHIEIAEDDLEHIVEVMGDAGGELSHGLHLLRLAQLVLSTSYSGVL